MQTTQARTSKYTEAGSVHRTSQKAWHFPGQDSMYNIDTGMTSPPSQQFIETYSSGRRVDTCPESIASPSAHSSPLRSSLLHPLLRATSLLRHSLLVRGTERLALALLAVLYVQKSARYPWHCRFPLLEPIMSSPI